DLRPPTHDRPGSDVDLPPPVPDEPLDLVADGHRIAATGPLRRPARVRPPTPRPRLHPRPDPLLRGLGAGAGQGGGRGVLGGRLDLSGLALLLAHEASPTSPRD